MLRKYQLMVGQFFSNSNNVRATLILGMLLIAAIAGGAPSDAGG